MASLLPSATSAAGQNNSQGGFNMNQPWNGNGMSLDSARRLLNPAGIGGGGGLDMHSIGAFLDPAGIDSSSMGLNLFGGRPDPNANGIPNVLPNLGAASMIPQMPEGAFQNFNGGPGIYNHMAAQSMGGQMFNPGAMQQMPQPQIQQPHIGAKGGLGNPGYMPLMARPSNPDFRRR